MTDLGSISFILGISVIRDRTNRLVFLQQSRYIRSILNNFNMAECNPTATPSDPSIRLAKPSEETPINQTTPYRQAIGSLMYLMLATRPDIAASLSKAAQYATNYDSTHWTAVKRIIRYIKGTADYALTLGKSSGNKEEILLTGSCDADWGGDLDDRRSTTGYVFMLNSHVISWQSRKQTSVATSSTQAEYQSLSSATKEALWLRMFLEEISFKQQDATVIQQDNQLIISLTHNPINHGRTKHIDIAHHHLRECIQKNEIKLAYCPTSNMIADIMTKPLTRIKFESCRSYLDLRPIPIPHAR